jgi:hypothetical protein
MARLKPCPPTRIPKGTGDTRKENADSSLRPHRADARLRTARNDKEEGLTGTAKAVPSHLLFDFIPFHDAVFDVDHAVGVLGDVVLVSNQHDGVAFAMQTIE